MCRVAKLTWESSHQRWRLLFSGIRLAVPKAAPSTASSLDVPASELEGQASELAYELDLREVSALEELYLGMYTPRGLYVYRHDLALGLTRAGRRVGTAFTSFKKVLGRLKRAAEEGDAAAAAVANRTQLVSFHSTSKGFFAECGRRGGRSAAPLAPPRAPPRAPPGHSRDARRAHGARLDVSPTARPPTLRRQAAWRLLRAARLRA